MLHVIALSLSSLPPSSCFCLSLFRPPLSLLPFSRCRLSLSLPRSGERERTEDAGSLICMRMRLWHTKICYVHACVCGIQRFVHALVCGIQRFVLAHFVTRHHQLKSIILMRQNATDFYKQLLSLLKSSPQDIDCAPAHHSVRTQDVCASRFCSFSTHMRIYHSVQICGHPEFRMRTDLNGVIYAETEFRMRTHLNRVIYITLL